MLYRKYLFICSLFFSLYPHTATSNERSAPAVAAFEKLKLLAGNWQGTLPDGKPITISYEQIRGGAILEIYHSPDPIWWNMSTAYHLANQHIVMTHYCGWGNHPRMRASPSATENIDQLEFSFMDITHNRQDKGYMQQLNVRFDGNSKLSHHWIWREGDKETALELHLTRINNPQLLTHND